MFMDVSCLPSTLVGNLLFMENEVLSPFSRCAKHNFFCFSQDFID
jgi:hypothetical protein